VAAIAIVMGVDAFSAGLLLSVTAAVKPEAPLVVGIPEIFPVEGVRINPAGSLPEAIDQM
jgi:hypothetical protein